jgi:hypothetical protein
VLVLLVVLEDESSGTIGWLYSCLQFASCAGLLATPAHCGSTLPVSLVAETE